MAKTHRVFNLYPAASENSNCKILYKSCRSRFQKGAETILLVEDEIAVLDTVTTMPRRHDFRVIPSSSAEEALQIAGSSPDVIDLLLTDVVMPEMNGINCPGSCRLCIQRKNVSICLAIGLNWSRQRMKLKLISA